MFWPVLTDSFYMKYLFFFIRPWVFTFVAVTAVFMFFSCQITPPARATFVDTSFPVMGTGLVATEGLVSFFKDNNSDVSQERVRRLAEYYREESVIESVNSDVAFVQMCLETGFLRFGGP